MYGDGLVFACAASCVQFVCKREGQVVGLAEEEAGAGRWGGGVRMVRGGRCGAALRMRISVAVPGSVPIYILTHTL